MTIKCRPLLWIRALVGFLGIIDTPRLWQLAFVTVKQHNGIVFSSLGSRGKNLKDKEWNPAGMLWTASCLMWSWLHSGTLVSTLLTASPSCPLGGSICEHDAVTALTTFWGIFGWSVLKQRKVLNCSDIFFCQFQDWIDVVFWLMLPPFIAIIWKDSLRGQFCLWTLSPGFSL